MKFNVEYKTFNYQNHTLEYAKVYSPGLLKNALPFLRKNVIFLHGFNGPWQLHIDMLQLMAAKGYTAYAINMPGHGNSDHFPYISWEILCDIVVQFCSELKLRNVNLCGFSMGGGIALRLANDPKIKPMHIGVISPFCDGIIDDEVDVGRGIIATQIQTIIDLTRTKKERVKVDAENMKYTILNYGPMFMDYKLNLAHNHTPIDVVLLGEDHIVDPSKTRSLLRDFPYVNIKLYPGLSHDLYYISDLVLRQLVDYILE